MPSKVDHPDYSCRASSTSPRSLDRVDLIGSGNLPLLFANNRLLGCTIRCMLTDGQMDRKEAELLYWAMLKQVGMAIKWPQ